MGWGEFGQTGQGYGSYEITPVEVTGTWDGVAQLAAGHSHNLLLGQDGRVHGWGRNNEGQLDPRDPGGSWLEPRELEGLPEGLRVMAGGGVYSAAVTHDGRLWTWGTGRKGQLGRPSPESLVTPGVVQIPAGPVAKVACGWGHVIALTEAGEVFVHGFNEWSQLGTGGTEPMAVPTALCQEDFGGQRVVDIACGLDHSLAVTEEGQLFTWGFGGNGQLGHGTIANELRPCQVEALQDKVLCGIAGGWSHSAALTTSGQLWMWGGGEVRVGLKPNPK